jgi:hypothetical protein
LSKTALKLYNDNLYLTLLRTLTDELASIETFVNSLTISSDYIEIYKLVDRYEMLFNDRPFYDHIEYKLQKIFKSLYLSNPGPFDRGNSYYHLTLKVQSSELQFLDNVYGSRLSKLLKLFKILFAKIDNFFIDRDGVQIKKFADLLTGSRQDVITFITYNTHRKVVEQRKKLQETDLKKLPYAGLFHIVHARNLPSILTHGILSHNDAHKNGLVKVDISDQAVNSLRNREEPVLNHNLHEYAPLYINPKNPMMYRLCNQGLRQDLAVVRVNPNILLHGNVLFSDGNAASRSTSFYQSIEDFNKLNWKCINDQYWTNYPDGKRFRCSEVLVFGKIPLYYVESISVYTEEHLDSLLKLFPNHLGVLSEINRDYYF